MNRVHFSPPRRRARRLLAGAAIAALLGSTAAHLPARLDPGASFRVTASVKIFPGSTPPAQDNEAVRGRGVAVGGRSRIELLAYTPAPQGLTTDDIILTGDSGHVSILHANGDRVTEADDLFGGPAVITLGRVMGGGLFGGGGGGGGRAAAAGADSAGGAARGGRGGGGRGGRAARGGGGGGFPRGGRGGAPGGFGGRGRGRGALGAGFLSQVSLLDVHFTFEQLGDGGAMDGRPTKHARITSTYRVLWGDQNVPATAVTDIWTADLPTPIPNPFEPLIVSPQSTDGPLIEYALKLRAIRAQLAGTPIKVVTTTTLTGVADVPAFQSIVGTDPASDTLTVIQQTEIRSVQPADVDPKTVTPPASESP